MVMQLNNSAIPKHLAIIMDGNRRWSVDRDLPKISGYKKGSDAAFDIIIACKDLSVRYLTLYTFSTENWMRSKEEVKNIIDFLDFYLTTKIQNFIDERIKLSFIGNLNLLPNNIIAKIKQAEKITSNNETLSLNIAISYGSRQEITDAICSIINEQIVEISEKVVENFLYTRQLPDPDFLIRTGGEKRLSNFLLWQCAYTELYFCDTLWPDFNRDHLVKALGEYSNRNRRYGR